MNPSTSVKVHGTIPMLALKGMADLELVSEERWLHLENWCASDSVSTVCLDTVPSFILAAWKLKVIPLFMGQRLTG